MKIRLGQFLFAAALLLGGAASAQAQQLKVGYVDTQRVINECVPGKAAQSRLQEEFSKRRRALDDQESALGAAAAQLDKDAPSLSETERTRRGRDLADQGRALDRAKRQFEDDLEFRKGQEYVTLKERVQRAIKAVAQERKIDLVFVEHVAFAKDSADLSAVVIDAVNAQR
ncbi:OmpH family outer membrane protein [Roseateles chitosanitabidus]|jgi:outer membrane protein|uniref:OmpH family outer membrane protein n=1 Tax=Roseateles chitosanitabidus TaxID=65048 RepID=UPI000833F01D|nr:OmpH family outer membrane protein [Roseateles chitosanitabidus]MBO9685236.1 OmpH family outer membrane protein [Roseateles chitosanitabidus]